MTDNQGLQIKSFTLAMINFNSANIASMLLSSGRPAAEALTGAGAASANGRGGAGPAYILDLSSGGAPTADNGYDLFGVKHTKTLLDKQIEVATQASDAEGAMINARAEGDFGEIVSQTDKYIGLRAVSADLAEEVEKELNDSAALQDALLEVRGQEAVKEMLADAAEATDETEATDEAVSDGDLDEIAKEAEAAGAALEEALSGSSGASLNRTA
ncbi:MAG: hypothetical protein AAGA09_04670 [Pseudomonadota bacterium]